MAIKNKAGFSFWNIQSEPINHGNHYRVVKPHAKATRLTLSNSDSAVRYRRNPLSDVGFFRTSGGASKRRAKSKSRAEKRKYFSAMNRIPTRAFSKTTASHLLPANTLTAWSSVKLYTPKPPPRDVPASSTKSEVVLGSLHGSDAFLREHSLTNMRPELIASFDWVPVQKTWGGGLSDLDHFLEFRWIMRQLQIENVEETMKKLKEEDVGSIFSDLEQQYDWYVAQEKKWVKWRMIILRILRQSRRALDIKDADNGYLGWTKGTLSRYSDSRPSGFSIDDPSLEALFVNSLGFSEEGYAKFCNSKVMGQLLNDLNYICYHHSPVFLPVKSSERSKDKNSTKINRRFIPSEKKYRFRAGTVGNRSQEKKGEVKSSKFDATDFKDYSKFLSTLPVDDADQIKVLVNTLSKEFRVSAGIGYLDGSSLGKRFRVTSSRGPFRAALGYPRSDIMEENVREGSLASFILMNDASGRLILPFETRTFSDKKGRSAIPGNVALVDTILRFGYRSNGLDTHQYVKFAEGYNKTADDVVEYIESLLNLDDSNARLHARTIYVTILRKFQHALRGLINDNRKSDHQIIFSALMNLAREDASLRHMMLRFILEVRDSHDAIATETSLRDVLEADADSPKVKKRKTPNFKLSTVGAFSDHPGVTPSYVQSNFGISSGAAASLLTQTRQMSAFNSLMVKANVEKQARKKLFSLASRWQDTAIRIAVKARKLMDTQAEIPRQIGDRSILNVRKGGVVAALRHSLSKHANHLPVAMIIDIAREIQDKADDLADRRSDSATFMSPGKLTKYNGWDENTLIAIIFEVFTLLYSRYINADFARKNRDLYVKYSAEKNDKVFEAITDVLSISRNKSETARTAQAEERLSEDVDVRTSAMIKDMAEGNLSTAAALQSVTNEDYDDAVFADIHGFLNAYDKESEIVYHMLSIIDGIGESLVQQANQVKRYFSTSDLDISAAGMEKFQQSNLGRHQHEQIRRYLAFKAKSKFGRDILNTLTEHALALNMVAAEKFGRRKDDDTWLPADMIIEIEELNAIKTFLNNPAMKGMTGDNIRVLTVGIPAETLEVLQNPPYIMGSRFNTELPVQKDVFEIHVHKRDLEWEDVVFKPKKFVFDRSMFLLSEAFKNVKSNNSYDTLVKSVDFTNATLSGLKEMSAMDIYNAAEYNFLSADQRISMIQNHVSNRILHLYYRLLSGLHMDENTFLVNDGWGDLLVDRDAATMLQLAQLNDATFYWLNTGTVPAMNILIETNIDWDHTSGTRLRVGTYQDSEIFTRPTYESISSFARDATDRVIGPEQPYRKTIETTDNTYSWDSRHGSKRRSRTKKTYVDTFDTTSRARSLGVTNYAYGKGTYSQLQKTTHKVTLSHPGRASYSATTATYGGRTRIYQSTSYSRRGANPQLEWNGSKVRVLAREMHRLGSWYNPWSWGKKKKKKKGKGAKIYTATATSYRTITRPYSYFNMTTTSQKEYIDWGDEVNKERRAHNQSHNKHEWDAKRQFMKRFYFSAPRCSREQLQHFRMITAGRIFSPIVMTNQIIAARQFDRVMMLPVDPDDFEIDMDATLSILDGKETFEKDDFLKLTEEVTEKDGTVTRKLKPRHRSENYSSFNDFYVTISTITHEEKK